MMFVVLLAGCTDSTKKPFPTAVQGQLSIADWSWENDGLLPLDGQWSFRWFWDGGSDASDRSDDVASDVSHSRSFITVPGTWGSNISPNGPPGLRDQGKGIYTLDLRHPRMWRMMAIRVPNISTAYTLKLNGKIMLSRGEPGHDAAHTVPDQKPQIVYFQPRGTSTTLELTVANFHHRRGGIRSELVMGTPEQIQQLQNRHYLQDYIQFGAIFMIGMYHIGLYLLRRKEAANLYFALLCLFVALRSGLIGEVFVRDLLPFLNWTMATRLEYIALVGAVWAGFAFFARLYPEEIGERYIKVSAAIAGVLTVATLALPTIRFTSYLIAYQVYALVFSLYALYALLISTARGREGAKLALVGFAGILVAIVNDIMFYNDWWRSFDLLPFGLLFLIVMNAFIISQRTSRMHDRSEHLSAELKAWNDKLEEKIAERTEELRRSYMTLEEAKTGLERMEQSRRHLVSNISHDLRTPITLLQGYLEALRDGVIAEPVKRDETIRLMLGKVEGLGRLIYDLFELSVLEARRVELTCEKITLGEWAQRLTGQYELELREKGISFRVKTEPATAEAVPVSIDLHRMDRVFANLIYNAERFTPRDGEITVCFTVPAGGRRAVIAVADTGSGIRPDDLPYIFDRFYKKDKSRNSSSGGGSGLGLAIAKEIVELHGGSIGVSNRHSGGSEFRIELPL